MTVDVKKLSDEEIAKQRTKLEEQYADFLSKYEGAELMFGLISYVYGW